MANFFSMAFYNKFYSILNVILPAIWQLLKLAVMAEPLEKLRKKMHRQWENDLIGIKLNDKLGYPSIEIDESKIIIFPIKLLIYTNFNLLKIF